MGDSSSGRPSRLSGPVGAGITWAQLAALIAILGTLISVVVKGQDAIAREGATARAEAKELVAQESRQARELFATRADMRAQMVKLEAIERQLDTLVRLLERRHDERKARR